MRYRGQRVPTRKPAERRSSGSGWEEKFNLRASRESVEAAFEEGGDEREGGGRGGSLEQEDGEKENYREEEEEVNYREKKVNYREEEKNYREEDDLEWRRENSLGDCDARLSEMVALMQKAGARIQFGDSPIAD